MSANNEKTRLSYKFQRLREKLRAAIDNGELSGKLPGERSLARRFHVNAKTLSKALTDLAAEGVLDRSIGRGTFVKGSVPKGAAPARWLIICDPDQMALPHVQLLAAQNPDAEIVTDVAGVRPSFMNQFGAVIDIARATPSEFLRDLMLRHVRLVSVGREPQTYSVNAIIPDYALAVSQLARELLLAGHRRFGVIEERGQTTIADGLRRAAQRFSAECAIDIGSPKDARLLVESGVTALICDSPLSAQAARSALQSAGISVPARVSVAALGVADTAPCSGYFVPPAAIVESVTQLLRDPPLRPATLWLTPRYHDGGTTSANADVTDSASDAIALTALSTT